MRVLLQDSTIISIQVSLFELFSGVSNAHASVCNACIQCVYDLIDEIFICFTIDLYTNNDLKSCARIRFETRRPQPGYSG